MEDFTIKVPGIDFYLSSKSFYFIREVHDKDAPSGYQRADISKHPIEGVDQNIIVPFDIATNTWNTGFYINSACFQKEDPKIAKETVDKIKKFLIPHIKNTVAGDIEDYSEKNNALFDNFKPLNGDGYGLIKPEYRIKGGNIFNTTEPLKFLSLYWALISGEVRPPGTDGDPKYIGIPYILEDKKRTSTVKEDNEFAKISAMSEVLRIIGGKDKNDKQALQNLFTYLGFIIDIEKTPEKTLVTSVSRWMDAGGYNNENAKEFNSASTKFQGQKGQEELQTYVDLLDKIKKGKINIERKNLYLDGTDLGSDRKVAASKIYKDKELYKKFLEL